MYWTVQKAVEPMRHASQRGGHLPLLLPLPGQAQDLTARQEGWLRDIVESESQKMSWRLIVRCNQSVSH